MVTKALHDGASYLILGPRTAGKTTLQKRMQDELQHAGRACAYIDFNMIGTCTVAEWFYSAAYLVLGQVREQLQKDLDLDSFWEAAEAASPAERWNQVLAYIAQRTRSQGLVLLLDEVDALVRLKEVAAAFFTSLSRWTAAGEKPGVAVCLAAGVGTHHLTVQLPEGMDTEYLTDFTLDECRVFQDGFWGRAEREEEVLKHVYEWTQGHPMLTQALGLRIQERFRDGTVVRSGDEEARVRQIVQEELLADRRGRRGNYALQWAEGCFSGSHPAAQPGELLALFNLYRRVWRGDVVPENRSDRLQMDLWMTGMVRWDNGVLQVRNRIFREAFDADWQAIVGKALDCPPAPDGA